MHLSSTFGGRRVGDIDLDAVNGSRLEHSLQAWIDARWHEGTFHSDDGLLVAQRFALALVDLCCGDLPDDIAVSGGFEPEPEPAAQADRDADRSNKPALQAQTRHGERRPSVSLLLVAKTLFGCPIEDLEDLSFARPRCNGSSSEPPIEA